MKKHLWVLALCCLLLLLPVAAAAEEALPVEWVRFGYGLPASAAVEMHELKEENITLEGALFETTVRNGKVYVSFLDLASAKLLTEHGAELEKLGISLGDMKIAGGQLQILRQDAALTAKLESFLKDKKVGLSVGDSFHLGNGAEKKLIVRIGGFETEPEGNSSKGSAPKTGSAMDVKSVDSKEDFTQISGEKRPQVTTIYLNYCGTTTYTEHYEPPVCWSAENGGEEEPPQNVQTKRVYQVRITFAYSQEDLDTGNQYYFSIETKDGSQNVSGKAADTVGEENLIDYSFDEDNADGSYTLPEIIISRDRDGKDIVKKSILWTKLRNMRTFWRTGALPSRAIRKISRRAVLSSSSWTPTRPLRFWAPLWTRRMSR